MESLFCKRAVAVEDKGHGRDHSPRRIIEQEHLAYPEAISAF